MSTYLESVRSVHYGFRLVLVGMIEAIALEMVISSAFAHEYFWRLDWMSAIAWAQLGTNLGAIVLAAVCFSTILSFQQVGTPLDFVAVFAVGASQYFSIGLLGEETILTWCFVSGFSWAVNIINLRMLLATRRHMEQAQPALSRYPTSMSDMIFVGLAVSCWWAGTAYYLAWAHWLSAVPLVVGIGLIALGTHSVFQWWHAEADPRTQR